MRRVKIQIAKQPGQSLTRDTPAGRLSLLVDYLNAARDIENGEWLGLAREQKAVWDFAIQIGNVTKNSRMREVQISEDLAYLEPTIPVDAARVDAAVRDSLRRLKSYVDAWLKCSPNGHEWKRRFPAHHDAIQKALSKASLFLRTTEMQECALLWRDPEPRSCKETARWFTDKLFAYFLHESFNKLGVCKTRGCGRYFEKTPQRTDYHDKTCGNRNTSRAAKKESHHLKRHRQFARTKAIVEGLLSEYSKGDLRLDEFWKTEVVSRSASPKISLRWLNEATSDVKQDERNPFSTCEECGAHRKQIQKMLGLTEA